MATSELETTPQAVLTAYFDALTRHDLDAIAAAWAPDGHCHVAGQADAAGPDGVRAYWAELFGASPDMRIEIDELIAEGEQVAVKWSATGTFAGPGSYQGIEPTYARLDLEGLDLFRLRDGLIVARGRLHRRHTFARQIGLLPPRGSSAEQRMAKAFNGQAKFAGARSAGLGARGGGRLARARRLPAQDDERLPDRGSRRRCDDVRGRHQGDVDRPRRGRRLAGRAQPHRARPRPPRPSRRGAGPAGAHALPPRRAHRCRRRRRPPLLRLPQASAPARWTLPRLLPIWDGGPVAIAGTVDEGDDVSGFRVVHIPGHAPGMIALFRESDRVALTADCFYTLDPGTGRHGPPRVPMAGFNLDTEQARASIRKIAALEPSVAWPGHADAVTGDVRAQLERAASETVGQWVGAVAAAAPSSSPPSRPRTTTPRATCSSCAA